jgi:hypothetical protein
MWLIDLVVQLNAAGWFALIVLSGAFGFLIAVLIEGLVRLLRRRV